MADEPPSNIVDRGFRSAMRGESTAFGFSIMITVTFGAVQRNHGTPEQWDLVLFALGAVAAFTVLETIASRGFRADLPQHGSNVKTLGTAMNFASVLGAILLAIVLSAAIDGDAAWPVCSAAAALFYLLAESAELMLAERLQRLRGNPRAAEVEG